MPTLISPCTFPTVSRSSLISAFSPPQPAKPRDRHTASAIHARVIESPLQCDGALAQSFSCTIQCPLTKIILPLVRDGEKESPRRDLCRDQIFGMRKVLLIMRLPEITKSNDNGCSSQGPSHQDPQ